MNGISEIIGNVLSMILINIYECIYHPGNITDIFLEYNNQIYTTFTGSYFWGLFNGVKIVGIGLLIVTCLISLMEQVSNGDFTINNLFRYLLKFFMLYVVLLNAFPIFHYLLRASELLVTDMTAIIDAHLGVTSSTNLIPQDILANSLNKHIGAVSKIGLFLMSIIPYIVSVLYTVIAGFFATSRLIEIVVRFALSPIIIGISGIGRRQQVDAVKYVKHTAGILFQIVVILVISASITFTHSAMASNGSVARDPALSLVLEGGTREIDIDDNGNWQPAVSDVDEETYTKASTNAFTQTLLDPQEYIVGIGLMLSAIFMIFRSRDISTRLFS